MAYAALTIAFLLVCIVVGARASLAARPRLAAALAAAMVAAQLALLMSS